MQVHRRREGIGYDDQLIAARFRMGGIVRPNTRALAIGFALAFAVASSVAMAQRGGGSRGGGGSSAHGGSHWGGGHRGGSYHGSGYRHGGYYHGGHRHGGYYRGSVYFGFAGPLWYGSYYAPYAYSGFYSYPYVASYPPAYPRYYTYPYAYEAAAVAVPAEPQAYIERTAPDVASENSSLYYYCRESNLYYPYARECAGTWERVPATPRSYAR